MKHLLSKLFGCVDCGNIAFSRLTGRCAACFQAELIRVDREIKRKEGEARKALIREVIDEYRNR